MKFENERNDKCTKIKSISFSDQEGIFNVWDLCQQLIDEGVEGDFAEAGVTAGGNPIIMSQVCRLNDCNDRKVRMLDSFTRHPKCLDYENDELKRLYGVRSESEPLPNNTPDIENVKKYVKSFNGYEDIIEYHAGFFQESFLNLPDFKLALLRVDVNMLESHNLCMEYLYPRLVRGGFFISDDYISPGIKNEINKFIEDNNIKDAVVIGSENHIIYFRKP